MPYCPPTLPTDPDAVEYVPTDADRYEQDYDSLREALHSLQKRAALAPSGAIAAWVRASLASMPPLPQRDEAAGARPVVGAWDGDAA
jgi:hypothetical protein